MINLDHKKARQTTVLSFLVNILLTVIKLIGGIFGNSGALIADAVHSFSDLFTDIIVWFSLKITYKPADADHNYGHGKSENVASLLVSFILFVAGFSILRDGFTRLVGFIQGHEIESIGMIALIMAGISIVMKELLFRYQKHIGEKIQNQVIVANAWHNRSDALSSIGAFIGVGIALVFGQNFIIFDAIAQMFVSIFIFKVGYTLVRSNINQLMDISLDEKYIDKIEKIVSTHDHVEDFHQLRTRKSGILIVIDVHILVDRDLTVEKAHTISDEIEREIANIFEKDTIINVHIEPYDPLRSNATK